MILRAEPRLIGQKCKVIRDMFEHEVIVKTTKITGRNKLYGMKEKWSGKLSNADVMTEENFKNYTKERVPLYSKQSRFSQWEKIDELVKENVVFGDKLVNKQSYSFVPIRYFKTARQADLVKTFYLPVSQLSKFYRYALREAKGTPDY